MRQAAGQVAAGLGRLARLALGLCLVGLLAAAAGGWRLAQGPIEVPPLARLMEAAANRDGAARLEVGRATIAWEGWHGRGATPLELRLGQVRLRDADGTTTLHLPDAAVSLALPWLFRGQLAPRRIELLGPTLRLTRDAAGGLALALGETPEAGGGAAAEEMLPGSLLAELMAPPNEATPLGALILFGVRDARLLVADQQLGAVWEIAQANMEWRRLPGGGMTARGTGTLALGAARLPASFAAEAKGDPVVFGFRLALAEARPAELAALAPALAPLAALDAPARLDLGGRLDEAGRLATLEARLAARSGRLDLGAGRLVPIAGLDLHGALRGESITLDRARLVLDGPGTPTLAGSGQAERGAAGWRMRGRLALDAAPLAELARWWPEGLGGNERAWILENITAGTARDGAWDIVAEAGPDLSDLAVTALSGTLEVEDATVHWLRPVPPVEAARGRIGFGLEAVTVEVAAARQAGTQVQARGATIRLGFAPGTVPAADIALPLAGPLPEVLAVLQHPRLRLFANRPMPLKEPAGTLDGQMSVAFPLLADLPVEQLRLRAQARLGNVRLADILLGRPIERGQFDLAVDNDGLRLNGQASFAGIATRLGVEMDFRAGPPTQIVMRETVQARAEARALAALDLANEEVVRGPVGLDIRSERRRNGQGRVTVRADLREATLMIEPLAWSKPAGQNAGGEAVLRLQGEELAAIESFRVEAPALLLRGSAAFARGTRLERVTIAEARIAESRLTGEARPPPRPGGPWSVALRGPVLDLRQAMAEETPPAPPASPAAAPGPALALEGLFERILLGPGRELAAVEARLAMDGRGVLRQGRVAGRAGPRGAFEAVLAPRGAGRPGRSLTLTAADAGALLGAFGILESVQGGRLSVTASYAHDAPGAPLSGVAELDEFQVRNAPAIAKLLQAMTLFGLVEALATQGLGFAKLIAPFTLTPEALVLEEARAFSASLGLTAKGSLDRRRRRLAMEGTIVPAYIINSLLGNIPLFGRLFSPEAGGGVFAATFRLQGPLDDPQVSINPLAALTPGFLRGIFGLGQGGTGSPQTPPATSP